MTRQTSALQIDNVDVRVTRWTLAGDEETGLHRHEYDYVVVPLVRGRMRVTNADGTVVSNELEKGGSYFRAAGAEHTVRSDAEGELDFVEIEILRPAASAEGR
jgi:beta-alanine degradation protein BauB